MSSRILFFLLFFSALSNCQKAPSQGNRPNVILILVDDMGYSDLGCYGSEIRTPNLDNLAHNGLRYTQMYNTAKCTPSRSSLLTGRYPWGAGFYDMSNDGDHCTDQFRLVADLLKEAGYTTHALGKVRCCIVIACACLRLNHSLLLCAHCRDSVGRRVHR